MALGQINSMFSSKPKSRSPASGMRAYTATAGVVMLAVLQCGVDRARLLDPARRHRPALGVGG
jgi:hypothetical protein